MHRMMLKSIIEVRADIGLHEHYQKTLDALRVFYGTPFRKNSVFETYASHQGNSTIEHTGYLKQGVDLDSLQVSMVCDNGYFHFGGESFVADDGFFKVTIYKN